MGAAVLSAVLMVGSYVNVFAASFYDEEVSVSDNGYTKEIVTSNNPDCYFKFKIEGDKLKATGVCKDDNINAIWIQFRGIGANSGIKVDPGSYDHDKNAKSGYLEDSFSFAENLGKCPDGDYSLMLFTLPQTWGDYWDDPNWNNENALVFSTYFNHSIYLNKTGDEYNFVVNKANYDRYNVFYNDYFRCKDFYLIQPQTLAGTKVTEKIKLTAQQITEGCTTDYEKIKAVHDYVAGKLYYDYDYFNKRQGVTTYYDPEQLIDMEKAHAVCEGFTGLASSLLRSVGIPCKAVRGNGVNLLTNNWDDEEVQDNHSWNEAWCAEQNRWVIFDCAWDCQSVKGSPENDDESVGVFTKKDKRDFYFDITPEVISNDHRINNYFEFPEDIAVIGDVNADSTVDASDIAAMLKFNTGFSSELTQPLKINDADGNGEINIKDAIAIGRKIVFETKISELGQTL